MDKKLWRALAVLALGLGLTACSSGVGEPCTTAKDCGGDNAICIIKTDLPGGYCSTPCVPGNDETCPSEATCVREGASREVSGCYQRCFDASDCRDGYKCIAGVKDNPFTVCVGLSY